MTAAAVPQAARDVVLIDASAIYHQAWHAGADQPLSVAFQVTLEGVQRCANFRRDSLVAVCLDSKTNWRKEVSPEYKAQREKREAAFYDCFNRVKDRLRKDGFLLLEAEGYEADDVIATAVDAAVTAGHPVTVCSADKDLCQLLRHEGVSILRTSTWDLWDAAKATEKFGVPPSQLGDWLALVGDSSDNIAGIDGIGPKTAADLLKAHGSIPGIYDAMKDGTVALKGKKLEALQGGIPQLELARKLVALKYDAPIAFATIYETREVQKLVEEPETMETESTEQDGVAMATIPAAEATAEPQPQPTSAISRIQTTELEAVPVAANTPFEYALEPTNVAGAKGLAAVLQNSRLYPRLLNDAQILAVIIRGREIGLTALAALDVFSVVEGRLCPSSHFLIDRAEKDPNCEYFFCVETTDTAATWETKHRKNPKPQRLTYTLEDAKTAGLVKPKGAWEKHPGAMCRKMAGVFLARMVYPGATLNLYAAEEMGS